jgi:DNA-binding transcriptional MerR regulator
MITTITGKTMKKDKLYIQDLEKYLKVYRKKLYYWERVGKIPRSRRETMSNYRYWTEADAQKIKQIIEGKERLVQK